MDAHKTKNMSVYDPTNAVGIGIWLENWTEDHRVYTFRVTSILKTN